MEVYLVEGYHIMALNERQAKKLYELDVWSKHLDVGILEMAGRGSEFRPGDKV